MDRVLLAVYGIEIYRGGDSQHPAKFSGNVDLLSLFHEFVNHVLQNAQKSSSKERNGRVLSHRFTYCSHTLPTLNESEREAYGFFHAGRDGDSFIAAKVNPAENTHEEEKAITPDMYSMRDTFFYLKVPKEVGKKRAYLVLQRSEGQGIKGLLFSFLREFMETKGLNEFRVVVTNLVPEKVFTNMMQDGNFKELSLIKYGVPPIMEGTRFQEEMAPMEKGKMKVIYQSNNLGSSFKEWAVNLFGATRQSKQSNLSAQSSRVVVQIAGQEEQYDEVNMLLELNGKQKTFHLASSTRTQPDMDVTSNVHYDGHGRLRLDQLLEQAKELISDVSLEIPRNDIAVQN